MNGRAGGPSGDERFLEGSEGVVSLLSKRLPPPSEASEQDQKTATLLGNYSEGERLDEREINYPVSSIRTDASNSSG
jgi:hypothetical protein